MKKLPPISVTQIIAACGGNKALMPFVKRTSPAISKWISKGYVPVDHVAVVSIRSGIPRHLIRPDRPDLFPPPQVQRRRAA